MSATNLLNKGYRVASKTAGDDVSRARFVRVDTGEEHGRKRRPRKLRLPGFEAAFVQEGRTKFSKAVQAPNKNILVSGHNNIKIGRDVRKGHLRGYWIYTLSLEERKTCPSSCQHWQTCYGNNMPFAKRVDHTAPEFLDELAKAIERLCIPHNSPRGRKPARRGVLIRLHALGDFYSVPYVWFWAERLRQYPNLALYGYTARTPSRDDDRPRFLDAIGNAVAALNTEFSDRCWIRFSNGGLPEMSTVSIGREESCPPDAFVCPEQTGRTLGCDYCGACWGTRKNVAFLEH